MTKQEEIREGMARLAHLIWQRWMAYMLTHLDKEHIGRWKRQANTAYKDLSETEKASDRNIAEQYLAKVKQHYEQQCKECSAMDWAFKHPYLSENIEEDKSG